MSSSIDPGQLPKRPNTNSKINVEAQIPSKKSKTDTEGLFSLDQIMDEKMQKMKCEIEEKYEAKFEMFKKEVQRLSNDLLALKAMQENTVSPQQSPPADITANINNNENHPKWIVPEHNCNELYNKAGKQIVQFINEFLPKVCDYQDVFLDKIPADKWQELRAVVHYFWNVLPVNFDLAKEVRKERLNQRFVKTEQIKKHLEKFEGLIISKNGEIYECRWSQTRSKFLPMKAEPEIMANSIWGYPKKIKNDDLFIAICKKEKKLYTVALPTGETKFLRNLYRN
uniref:Uncharacterized protein n=1 Tax=Panagrolaimus sp. ES5 TaxID=591445 RepID=A0AC34FC26_9BILA